jgi:nicotinamidase-related amidase
MKTQTALLVIDVQRGAFDGARCPPIANGQALLARVAELIAAARAGGVPVLHVQHLEDVAESPFATGSPHGEIHPAVAPQGKEPVLQKRVSSAFDDTPLEAQLDAAGIGRIVTCGLQSEHCVTNTSLGALARGYSVLVARDAHSTWASEQDSAESISQRQNGVLEAQGAQLMATADVVALFAQAR